MSDTENVPVTIPLVRIIRIAQGLSDGGACPAVGHTCFDDKNKVCLVPGIDECTKCWLDFFLTGE